MRSYIILSRHLLHCRSLLNYIILLILSSRILYVYYNFKQLNLFSRCTCCTCPQLYTCGDCSSLGVRTRRDKISRTPVDNNLIRRGHFIPIKKLKFLTKPFPGNNLIRCGQFDQFDQYDTLPAEYMKSEGTLLFYVNEYVAAIYSHLIYTWLPLLLETWKSRKILKSQGTHKWVKGFFFMKFWNVHFKF